MKWKPFVRPLAGLSSFLPSHQFPPPFPTTYDKETARPRTVATNNLQIPNLFFQTPQEGYRKKEAREGSRTTFSLR